MPQPIQLKDHEKDAVLVRQRVIVGLVFVLLLIGVLVFHEPFGRDRAIGFAFIWVALAVFAADGVRRSRRGAPRVTG